MLLLLSINLKCITSEWASINLPEGTLSASSFEESLSLIKNNDTIENAVVIGITSNLLY